MFQESSKARVLELASKPYAIGGWLGMPYEGDDGCLRLLKVVFDELGLRINGRLPDLRKDARLFQRIPKTEKPQFGDVVVLKNLPFAREHVGFMLSRSVAIQSSLRTNGAGKIDITREPFVAAVREFWRLKCS